MYAYKRGLYIKQISRIADLKNKIIDAFSGCLYPPPSYISCLPRGKLLSRDIRNTFEVPLDFLHYWPTRPFENSIVEMRMINVPHNNRRLIRFDAAVCTHLNPSELRSEEHTSELQSLRHLVCRL